MTTKSKFRKQNQFFDFCPLCKSDGEHKVFTGEDSLRRHILEDHPEAKFLNAEKSSWNWILIRVFKYEKGQKIFLSPNKWRYKGI